MSSPPCWERASARSGCLRRALRSSCGAALRRQACHGLTMARAGAPAVICYTVALGARECLRADRVRRRRGSRLRGGRLGRRPRGAGARARLGRGERWQLAADAVPRFSGLAVGRSLLADPSGTISGYLQVRALRGLWETTYGQLLLVKLGLVLPLLALGLYNNRRAVPRLRGQSRQRRSGHVSSAPPTAELALMVAIVSVTAVLVSEPPARAEVAPRGPYATTAPLGDLELNLVVDPAAAGTQPDPPLPDRPPPDNRPTSTRHRSRRPSPAADRTAASEGAPCRPRPLRRPARPARSRRRLATPHRDSPRRLRRGDHNGLRPDQKGTPLNAKDPDRARARRIGGRARGERSRHRQPERGPRRTASPASPSASRTSARCRHDEDRRCNSRRASPSSAFSRSRAGSGR